MTTLVVQTSFLGDVVLTTALIAELAKSEPVDVLTTPEGSRILRNNPDIRNTIVFDRRGADRGIVGFMKTIDRIRHAGFYDLSPEVEPAPAPFYETAYLCQGSMRSALLVKAIGIANRIGFNTSEGSRFYTGRVEYRPDLHHAERLWLLSKGPGASPPSREQVAPRLYPSADDHSAVDALLRDGLADLDRPLIALAPGSAWGTKRWPFYHELAVKIGETGNLVVIGGNDDVATGDTIVAQLPTGFAVNAAGRLGILASAALIGRSTALVSNDSAPQHLASAMNTPTVVVFGPTVPAFGFGPLADKSAMAGVDGLNCRPCDRHGPQKCPLGHWRCMREVSSSDVFALLTKTLS